jgi:hypothetical protein
MLIGGILVMCQRFCGFQIGMGQGQLNFFFFLLGKTSKTIPKPQNYTCFKKERTQKDKPIQS